MAVLLQLRGLAQRKACGSWKTECFFGGCCYFFFLILCGGRGEGAWLPKRYQHAEAIGIQRTQHRPAETPMINTCRRCPSPFNRPPPPPVLPPRTLWHTLNFRHTRRHSCVNSTPLVSLWVILQFEPHGLLCSHSHHHALYTLSSPAILLGYPFSLSYPLSVVVKRFEPPARPATS